MNESLDVASTVGALAVHVDARDWDALLALFAPRVRVDYTSLFGGDAQVTQREALIALWRGLLPGFTHTTHVIGVPAIVVAGQTASVRASVVAWHFVREPELAGNDLWLVGGAYEMTLQRIGGVWRITELTLARAWQHGNLELPKVAAARATATSSSP
ncbi:MAG TPA: nuclear transport factor 2 family protein [Candidatus Acidoferrum sp.]|nr:nuclear transport factor 2 family protein [Candidatus Acidoferrum sp.]